MMRRLLDRLRRRPPAPAPATGWAVYETTLPLWECKLEPGHFVGWFSDLAPALRFCQEANREFEIEGEPNRYIARPEPVVLRALREERRENV